MSILTEILDGYREYMASRHDYFTAVEELVEKQPESVTYVTLEEDQAECERELRELEKHGMTLIAVNGMVGLGDDFETSLLWLMTYISLNHDESIRIEPIKYNATYVAITYLSDIRELTISQEGTERPLKIILIDDWYGATRDIVDWLVVDKVVEDIIYESTDPGNYLYQLEVTESGTNYLTKHFNKGYGMYEGEKYTREVISDGLADIYRTFITSINAHVEEPASE